MVRDDLEDIPQFSLADGQEFRPVTPETVALWTEIQRNAEPYFAVRDDLFRTVFGHDERLIRERCFLMTDSSGDGIGTISAWYDDDFLGRRFGRVHWVAIRTPAQGRGLAKPMMTFCLETLRRWHDNATLVTQEKRLPAISLYRKFGFRPFIASEQDEQVWESILRRLDHDR